MKLSKLIALVFAVVVLTSASSFASSTGFGTITNVWMGTPGSTAPYGNFLVTLHANNTDYLCYFTTTTTKIGSMDVLKEYLSLLMFAWQTNKQIAIDWQSMNGSYYAADCITVK